MRRSTPRGGHPRTRREDGAGSWLGCAEERRSFGASAARVRRLRHCRPQAPFQQDLSRFSIAVIVLRAPSNRVTDLRALIPQLLAALPVANRGAVTWVGAEQRA